MDFLRDYAAENGINIDALILMTGMSDEEVRRAAFTLELRPDGTALTTSYFPDLNALTGTWTRPGSTDRVIFVIGGDAFDCVFGDGLLSFDYGIYFVVLEKVG